MIAKIVSVCSLFTCLFQFSYGQSVYSKIITPEIVSKDNLLNAATLAKAFPKEQVLVTKSTTIYTFDRRTTKDKISVVEAHASTKKDFVTLAEGVDFFVSEGYSDMVEINSMKAKVAYSKYFKDISLFLFDRLYEQDNIFDSDARFKYFDISKATRGVQFGFDIEKTIKDVRYLTSEFFLGAHAAQERTIIYEVPDWLKVDIREFNFKGFDITKNVESIQRDNITRYTYVIKNARALHKEDYAPTFSSAYPHVVFVAKTFTTKSGVQMQIAEKVDDIYNWYSSLTKRVVNQKEELTPVVTSLLANKTDDIEKIKTLYYWVQDNIRYVAFERGIAGFQPEAAHKVYKDRYGDCKGMANLLTCMLQIAGFDAHLAWIGTNDIAYDYSLPSLCINNHMICALKYKGQVYFLDGTETEIGFNNYALRIQGKEALIDLGDKFEIQRVADLPPERNKYEQQVQLTLDGEICLAKVQATYSGERQTNFLRMLKGAEADRAERLTQALCKGDPNLSMAPIGTLPVFNREEPISITYELRAKNKVTAIGSELYVSMDWYSDFEALMPEADRTEPLQINTKAFREYKVELTIPDGYAIDYLPKPIVLSTKNYSFNISYTQEGNKVIMKKVLVLNRCLIPLTDMAAFRADIKQLKDINSEQIILKK
jgi:hypothetical protein